MRRTPVRILTLLALALVLAAPPARAQQGTGEDAAQAAEPIRELIADMKLDEASKAVSAFKAEHKSEDGKKLEKELSGELAKARKLKPAVSQIERLSSAKKYRDAYAAGCAAIDGSPGALALKTVKRLTDEARDKAFLVLGDFESAEPDPAWGVNESTNGVVADPSRGGKAMHWVPAKGSGIAALFKQFPDGVDLGQFEALVLRIRGTKPPTGQLSVRIFNTDTMNDFLQGLVPTRPTAAWQEVTIPIKGFEAKGKFDPKFVVAFSIMYRGVDGVEFDVDDVFLLRR